MKALEEGCDAWRKAGTQTGADPTNPASDARRLAPAAMYAAETE